MTDPLRNADETLIASWHELQETLRGYFARRVAADDVDDLLQDCFVRVSQGLADLRDKDRFGPWIFQIARNLVIDHQRRRSSQRSLGANAKDLAMEEDLPDLGIRIGGWLTEAIDRLPKLYAEVLRDSELRGIPYREIAERLDLSVSGVKSRVQRGREVLRAELLACCAIEFDRRGRVRDYERRTSTRCDC